MLFALVGLALPGPAVADEAEQRRTEAKGHFEAAKAAFEANKYREALDEYQKAYKIMPLAGLLFNMGQCHRNLGEIDQAIAAFEGYLTKAPDAPNKPAVNRLIAELKREKSSQQTGAAATAGAATATAPDSPGEPETPESQPTSQPASQPAETTAADLDQSDLDSVIGGTPTEEEQNEGADLTAAKASKKAPTGKREARPFYTQWWFWTAVAVVAAGTATGLYFGLRTNEPDVAPSRFPTWVLPEIN